MRLLISACFALVLVLALRSSTPTHAQTSEAWRIFTHTDEVNAVTVVGGEVWAATEGGVVRWDTATRAYQVFTIDDGLPANQARAILNDPHTGYVWVGTAAGLARWDGARWQKWSLPQGLCSRVDGLALDGRGRIWATTNASAALVDGVTGAVVRTCADMFTVMPDYLDDVLAATLPTPVWAIEANHAVWTSVGPSPGISRFDHAGRTTYCNRSLYTPANPAPPECTADLPALPSNVVDAVVITPDGSRWLGTGGGLVRWRPDGSASRIGADDLPAGRVRSLTVDSQGRVWLGVYGCVSVCTGAVARVEANDSVRPFYAQTGGLPSPDVREVLAGPDGALWVATTEGLTRITPDDQVDRAYKVPGLPSQQVNAVARDRLAGVIWVGTEAGLASFDQQTGQWTVYDHDTTNILPANAVHALIMVGGDLWVATGDNMGTGQRGGVSQRLADGRWVHHTRDGQDNPLGYVQALAKEDVPLTGSGYRIWAGSMGAATVGPQLFALDTDGRWLTWTSGTNASFGTIRDISVRSKHVWLATQPDGSRPGGLAVLDYGAAPLSGTGNWTLYRPGPDNALLSEFITSVAADNLGRVWIGTPLGVNRFVPDQAVNPWETYTVANTNGGLINNFINDIAFLDDLSANGAQMWFMTQGGVSQFDTQFRRWRSWARTDGPASVRNLTSTAYELSCKRWFGTSDGLSLLVFDACNNLGPTPTPFPTRTATFTPTPELSPTATPTLTPSATATLLPTATATATLTPSPTLILPPSRTPTDTPVPPPATFTPTASPTEPGPGATNTPTPTPTLSPTPSATLDPSQLIYKLYLPYILAAHKLPPPILGMRE